MIATTNNINAAGTSGYVQFYLQETASWARRTDGWTFQVDPTGTGNNYVTCLSDSTLQYNNLGWQKFTYTLPTADTGQHADDAIPVQRGRFRRHRPDLPGRHHRQRDRGRKSHQDRNHVRRRAHHDGRAGDRVYGAEIPAQATGTSVSYYVTATDRAGLTASDPAAVPAATYSYTVGATATSLAFNAGPATGVYGQTTTLAATLTEGGLPLGGETIAFSLNGLSVGTATTGTNGIATLAGVDLYGCQAGTYTAYMGAFFAGDSTNNYAASSVAENLTVSKASLTVTADSYSRPYGASLPTLAGTLTGVASGDNITVSYSCSATTGSDAGSYTITPTFNDPNNRLGNYTVTLNAGTLTITQVMPSVGATPPRAPTAARLTAGSSARWPA